MISTGSAEPVWSGPAWEDPALTVLAARLRDAHSRLQPLPGETRRRLHRHLLTVTDLAKRDPALAARKLETFLTELDTYGDPSALRETPLRRE
jgi:hypothetical protein